MREIKGDEKKEVIREELTIFTPVKDNFLMLVEYIEILEQGGISSKGELSYLIELVELLTRYSINYLKSDKFKEHTYGRNIAL